MNKIYRLKFDKRRNELVVVSEIASGQGKVASVGQVAQVKPAVWHGLLTDNPVPTLLAGLIFSLLPVMAHAAPELPVNGQIVAGSGNISSAGNQMTVQQHTQQMATDWQSFDIGKHHTVEFLQPSSHSMALNRVTGGSESHIMGNLKANGQVFLVNPNGILFGKDAQVNAAGIVASTKNISTADFMKGDVTFRGGSNPEAQVINQGNLTTTKGGYIVLAADKVSNSGTLSTPSGKTLLAAAQTVTLQLDNSGLTSASVDGAVVNALVENSGLISAQDGKVYLTAKGQDMLLKTVVNNSGTVDAQGLASIGGEIVLGGGDSGVVSQSGQLRADHSTGQGGKIVIEGQNIHLAVGSKTSATGETGGGEVYVGGGWQGKDKAIRHATAVVMDKKATIDVSATEQGDGGTAVLWSDDYTNFQGDIKAHGGRTAGNGGQVETSSHNNLQAFGNIDASAAYGKGGYWLLDPADITIRAPTDRDSNYGQELGICGICNSTLLTTRLEDSLNLGINVGILSKDVGIKNEAGNIFIMDNITKTKGKDATLSMNAYGSINMTGNKTIQSTSGKLNVEMLAGGGNPGVYQWIDISGSVIKSNGGDIKLGQANPLPIDGSTPPAIAQVYLNSATLDASSSSQQGNITLVGGVTGSNNSAVDILNGSALRGNKINISGVGNSNISLKDTKLDNSNTVELQNTLGNINIGNVTMHSDMRVQAKNININGDITKDGVGDATLTMWATNNTFELPAGRTISSRSGKLNLDLRVLGVGGQLHYIAIWNGAVIKSNGGDIHMGQDSPEVGTWVRLYLAPAVLVDTSSISVEPRGNITLTGSTFQHGTYGIDLNGSHLIAKHININAATLPPLITTPTINLQPGTHLDADNVTITGLSAYGAPGIIIDGTTLNTTGNVLLQSTKGSIGIRDVTMRSNVQVKSAGNIDINGNITKDSGGAATLKMQAAGGIHLKPEKFIRSTSDRLDVDLRVGGGNNQYILLDKGSLIKNNGGDIYLGQIPNNTIDAPITLSDTVLDTISSRTRHVSGNVTIDGKSSAGDPGVNVMISYLRGRDINITGIGSAKQGVSFYGTTLDAKRASITGVSENANGVDFVGTITGDIKIKGTAKAKGRGVTLEETDLRNSTATVTGVSQSGAGVATHGAVDLSGRTKLIGTSQTGPGVLLAGIVTGGEEISGTSTDIENSVVDTDAILDEATAVITGSSFKND